MTLPEDRLPLTANDLDAWLWRIDQVLLLLTQRAAGLSDDELDWQPPDGGWPLRRVLHHVARSEVLYAASIRGSSQRAPQQMIPQSSVPIRTGTFFAPAGVVAEVLALESELLSRVTT